MLKSTFLHIPGITEKTEINLWKNNISSWDDFLNNYDLIDLKENKKNLIYNYLNSSNENYIKKNHSFFSKTLPSNNHWRAYKDFSVCFLDIETTGLSKNYNEITTIGLYDGKKSRVFVNGIDMHDFLKEISKYGVIVTFNGKTFDIPFIEHKFKINLNQIHIDLRYLLKKFGFCGGLKKIEKDMGIIRNDDLSEVNGLEAVRLWKRYKRGDKNALTKLIEYNKADIENLKILMDFAFTKAKNECFCNFCINTK
ncbi:MAG: ribonuclease H-like domain-containing protein [Nanoarchaeota archaeon]